jgi:predicted amino acid dehydrogenase
MSWTEEEVIDLDHFTIHFRSLEGDLEKFDGTWSLKPHSQGTEVQIEVQAKIGIPIIEQLVSPILQEKIAKNFSLMLESINNKLVSERYKRFRKGRSQEISGFAIIGHPYNLNNLIRYLQYLKPQFRAPSKEFLSKIYELVPSYVMYDIRNFKSVTGKGSHGLVVVSTFIPDMLTYDMKMVFDKVVEACRVAEQHHIGIAALGGFTSIAGEKLGQQLQSTVNIPLTTGNTYTVCLALDGVKKACQLMGVDLSEAKVSIVGGTGDIGSGCAKILAEEVKELIVTGRNSEQVQKTVEMLQKINGALIRGTTDNESSVRETDVIIAAASVTSSIIDDEWFKPGAVVCDLAYPKNISYVPCRRDDILIFSGGLTEIPSKIELGFEIGLPSTRTLYGCFAEAILLDLEERYESFSYGKGNIRKEKVNEIRSIAEKHGFKLAPFFWGDRLLDVDAIRKIKEKAGI